MTSNDDLQRGTLAITQNGQAKAVVQDIDSYEQTQESLAILKLLAQSQREYRGRQAQTAQEGVCRPCRSDEELAMKYQVLMVAEVI